jgi:hypothetical protein
MKHRYICGTHNSYRFKEISRIIHHYAHETPKYFVRRLHNNRVYQALSVMLTEEEERLIRRDISMIGVPEGVRVEL